MAGNLKLRAHDPADLAVISAHLQDALVPVSDMAWLKGERRFLLLANRFRWEAEPEAAVAADPEDPAAGDLAASDLAAGDLAAGEPPARDAAFAETPLEGENGRLYSRIVCGACFDRVNAVKVRGFDPRRRDRILNLLALKPEREAIRLIFAGGGEVRLEIARIVVHLEDLGESWPTHWRPSHALDDRGAAG